MPEAIKALPSSFYDHIEDLSFQEIAYRVADAFWWRHSGRQTLKDIVYDTLNLMFLWWRWKKKTSILLELFLTDPIFAFRMLAVVLWLGYWATLSAKKVRKMWTYWLPLGDTGSAVANGFLGVEGIHVYVLYPKGKGWNTREAVYYIGTKYHSLEVDGTFDDCQCTVKSALR